MHKEQRDMRAYPKQKIGRIAGYTSKIKWAAIVVDLAWG